MWYILNYVPPRGMSRANLPRLVNRFSVSRQGSGLELFAPTFFTIETKEGKSPRQVERPLMYHYIFVRGDEALVKDLCATYDGFSFVLDHTGSGRHLTLPDETMEAFRIMARLHGNKLECYAPEDIDLQEGDKVQVMTGEFAGLTGTYLPRKGGRTGNIVVAVTQNMGAVVYDINADSVRVLEFAQTTRRPYDQMDAYIPRLLSLLQSPQPLSSAIIFTRRFGSVRLGNPKVEAKLNMMLYASYHLIGDMKGAAAALKRYQELAAHITNVWTRALCHLILGLLNGDPEELAAARALISGTEGASVMTGAKGAPRLSALQSQIASLLTP